MTGGWRCAASARRPSTSTPAASVSTAGTITPSPTSTPGTLRVASLAASDVQPILRERPEFAEQMATLVAERKHHLDELTDKAAADAGKSVPASEHSTLLDEIAGFFHLPRQIRRGNGPRP